MIDDYKGFRIDTSNKVYVGSSLMVQCIITKIEDGTIINNEWWDETWPKGEINHGAKMIVNYYLKENNHDEQ